MSIYGEGMYQDVQGNRYHPVKRRLEDMQAGQWELTNDAGEILTPIPVPETASADLTSVYALTKYDQEKLCLILGKAYNIPTVALRFFNVYGSRQALSNPYTGAMVIFATRLLNDNPPLIYEDGEQQRDFIHVFDIVQGCRLALEVEAAAGNVFNLGNGGSYPIKTLAQDIAAALGKDIEPEITGKYRFGDIRHCFADITRAREVLGYEPKVSFADGMSELATWLEGQVAVDTVDDANSELAKRGLTR
jgi:dTDP-L-rhamnose 4-epimerase